MVLFHSQTRRHMIKINNTCIGTTDDFPCSYWLFEYQATNAMKTAHSCILYPILTKIALKKLLEHFSYTKCSKQNGVTYKLNFRTSSKRHTCNRFKRFQNRRTAKAGERLP